MEAIPPLNPSAPSIKFIILVHATIKSMVINGDNTPKFRENPNAVILQRKYQKACALRLELEENGEILAFPSQYRAESAEQKGVQTTGDNANYLNNQLSIQEE